VLESMQLNFEANGKNKAMVAQKIPTVHAGYDVLQHSEASFRTIFEDSAVGIGILGLDRRLIDANPALCRMFGMSREELVGQTPEVVTYPEDYPQSTADFQAFLSGAKEFYQTERRYLRKGSGPFWAHVTMSFIRGVDRQPLYIIGMVLDIDERQRLWQELQESEANFRAVFDNAGIGIGLIGLDRRPIQVNAALLKMSGYDAEEMYQLSGVDLGYPEDSEIGIPELQDVLAGNLDTYQIEKRYIRKNGQVYWVRLTNSVMRTADGKPQYLVSMIEDIDAQVKIWAELQESEARFRAMFDNTAIGMTLSTLDRRVLQMNEALTRITGYSLEDIKDLHPTDLAHPEDRSLGKQEFTELLEGKRKSFSLERRYYHKSGRVFWGRVTYSLVCNSEGKPCNLVGLMEDITEEKLASEKIAAQEAEYRQKLEQEVEERTHELKQINQQLEEEITQRQKAEKALADQAAQDAILHERSRLARDLHDAVTQTLFSASLIAEVLPDLWEINPDEGQKRLEELRQLTRGALAEMRTLLVELRPNSLVQIPLPDLLRQLCESLIGRTRLPIHFIASGQGKIPPDVQVAFYRITQEALNNIIKHAKATKVVVTLQMGNSIRLVIVDDGCGFDLAKVTANHMGLKIMCERTESIGAHCAIYSQPGEGTQITITWENNLEQEKG
jgi:PAS domain S-box-containing protein